MSETLTTQSEVQSAGADAERFPLTIIVLTRNEAANICDCLSTVEWADEIIVVDSGSTDRTLEIAREKREDVRWFEHEFEDFGEQRNWALDETIPRHEWILFLDADERCTPELAREIQEVVGASHRYVGYYLTYRNMFLGRWLKRSTLYPSWQLRLLKMGEVRFCKEGHGQREMTGGAVGYLQNPYDHYPFHNGLEHWIARHNVYSSAEVGLMHDLRRQPLKLRDLLSRCAVTRRRCLKRMGARVPFRPAVRFLYTYVLRGGLLDGVPGFIYCCLLAQYEFQLWAKCRELEYRERDDLSR